MALQSWVIFEELGGFNSSKRISLPTREVYPPGKLGRSSTQKCFGKMICQLPGGYSWQIQGVLKQPSYKLFIKRSLKQTTPQKFINWDQLRLRSEPPCSKNKESMSTRPFQSPKGTAPVYSLVQGMAKEIRSIRPRRTRKPPQPGTTRWEVSG